VVLSLLAACGPAPEPRYVVGVPYELGGVWSYPREDFSLVETGLASVAADRWSGRVTANGEVHDPARAMAAHRTLQLPAVLAVTNLENGREILLRVNDRGPAAPTRVLELSGRAAELLGVPAGGGTRIRLEVRPEESRRLAGRLPQAEPAPPVAVAAPRGAVAAEALAPPPGARGAAGPDLARPAAATVEPDLAGGPTLVLPETVTQGQPAPGLLWVEAGSFTGRAAAERQAARLPGARAQATGAGPRQSFRVRIGPLATVAEADRTLERVLASGVSGARILID
jgi:rare lipoprotein A